MVVDCYSIIPYLNDYVVLDKKLENIYMTELG